MESVMDINTIKSKAASAGNTIVTEFKKNPVGWTATAITSVFMVSAGNSLERIADATTVSAIIDHMEYKDQ